jgi:hypothetical protein
MRWTVYAVLKGKTIYGYRMAMRTPEEKIRDM